MLDEIDDFIPAPRGRARRAPPPVPSIQVEEGNIPSARQIAEAKAAIRVAQRLIDALPTKIPDDRSVSLPEATWKGFIKLAAAKGVGVGVLIAEAHTQYLAIEDYRTRRLPQ